MIQFKCGTKLLFVFLMKYKKRITNNIGVSHLTFEDGRWLFVLFLVNINYLFPGFSACRTSSNIKCVVKKRKLIIIVLNIISLSFSLRPEE